jgi:hypothetical protein
MNSIKNGNQSLDHPFFGGTELRAASGQRTAHPD